MPDAKKVVKMVGLFTALGGASYLWVRLADEIKDEIRETTGF